MTSGPGLAPSPPGSAVFGHVFPFRRDPLGFLQDSATRCGPVTRLRLGPLVYHLVSDPALVSEILLNRSANYARDGRSARQMRLVTGESLLSTSGETWRRHRRLAQPVFHPQRLPALAAEMVAVCRDTIARWEIAAREGTTLDLASEMSRLTFSVVGRCFFGSELGPLSDRIESAFPVLLEELFQRSRAIATLPLWLPTPRHRRFKHALAQIDEIVTGIVRARHTAATPRDDLLGLLLQARDEDGSALSDAEIRNHVITFLLAGHETTASTLTWAFSLLDRHHDARDAAEHELDRVLADRLPAWEDLPNLREFNAALQETLRLYPAIWIAERRVISADTLSGFAIPAGSTIVLSAYVTQRLRHLWPDPDTFHPSRFLSVDSPPAVATGYFPFGAGPHHCIGQHFALLEARLVLAALLSRFRIRLLGEFPSPLPGITLRPAAAVPVRVERRTA